MRLEDVAFLGTDPKKLNIERQANSEREMKQNSWFVGGGLVTGGTGEAVLPVNQNSVTAPP